MGKTDTYTNDPRINQTVGNTIRERTRHSKKEPGKGKVISICSENLEDPHRRGVIWMDTMYSLTHLLSIYCVPSSVVGIGDTKGNKTLFYFIQHTGQSPGSSLEVFEKFPEVTHRKQETDIHVNGSLEVFRVLSQSGSHRVIGLGWKNI